LLKVSLCPVQSLDNIPRSEIVELPGHEFIVIPER
jgi:hypothetical protein